jgi:hypothetical protein
MNTPSEDNHLRVVKFVQELLLDTEDELTISAEAISQQIDLVLAMKPSWGNGLDREKVTDELIRRFSVWIGKDTTLKNEEDHVHWLNTSRKTNWRYWPRYREWMEAKLSWKAIDALDRSTDTILGLIEDPLREDPWDRRGLIVGHVQSGKTGSYTGLICKAADAGYKIVIVLAGMHNNLRSQTQVRLDEGFLGFATSSNPGVISFTGVGLNGRDADIKPNCATNRSDNGDFNRKVAKHLAITPEQRPWLFVVKKNKSVLTLLLDWIRNHAANAVDAETGRKLVTHLPLLVIDDEADHASVDTGEQLFDSEGVPDEEHQPKAINSLIRRILHSFSHSAYVGYTATPFANIFIHERGTTRDEGPDLFPSAFIVNLAAPSDYVGPARIFGAKTPERKQDGLPLVRNIGDQSSDLSESVPWMPTKHKNGHLPRYDGCESLPPSLVEAVDAFLLACAVRSIRGQRSQHCSMLVHVTRFTSVQHEVFRQVEDHVRQMRQRITRRIDHEGALIRLRRLWEDDFVPTSATLRSEQHDGFSCELPPWESLEAELMASIVDVEVRMINGSAKDSLDYTENPGRSMRVIAIGGDKLSRGLTLEGLCTSYFLRSSKMYDTLMQMGRWFGYRPGYLDICRLYTTPDLTEWFGHIADAAEELREEFDIMGAIGSTPREYGLKVQSHPVLMVTSRLKMRSAQNLRLSFSGQLLETVSLYRDPRILSENLSAARQLIQLHHHENTEKIYQTNANQPESSGTGMLLTEVPSGDVINFLSAYRTHPAAYRVNSNMLADFVQSMNCVGELTTWTVSIASVAKGRRFALSSRLEVGMSRRTGDPQIHDRYSIGRLLDPKDEAVDLKSDEWQAALKITQAAWTSDPGRLHGVKMPEFPNGPAIRRIRGRGAEGVQAHPERGLLVLYVLDPERAHAENTPKLFSDNSPPVIAFGISFPVSDSSLKVDYKVNNILWEQEYGAAD